jgi:DNA-3-methyladenine glycosylase I
MASRTTEVVVVDDGKTRCFWSATNPVMAAYHDEEWGVPLHEDRRWYEKIVLDGAQAGLSWLTILKKRDAYREAFAFFDFEVVARFGARDEERLMKNAGIVRNRLKIKSAIGNALAFVELRRQLGTFDDYIWKFVGGKPVQNKVTGARDIPARTELSDLVSKDLKKRGFSFVGTTIVYAFLQAAGVVNDHTGDCFRRKAIAKMR